MRFTEEQLTGYTKPISSTEKARCKNAIEMISQSLKEGGYDEKESIKLEYENTLAYSTTLKKEDIIIKLLVQGSYANNTNVKTESDVDIAVIQEDTFNTKYGLGKSKENYGFIEGNYNFLEYKRKIYNYLEHTFTHDNICWKNKCILVRGNSYRVDADAVPSRRYRDYTSDLVDDPDNFIGGINIISDDGENIINYPEQHIKNGRDKNNATNYFYKKIVRIMKKIRYIMIDKGIPTANNVSSFSLESLLWNIDNDEYTHEENYIGRVLNIVNFLKYTAIDNLDEYKEANGIKSLCENNIKKNNLKIFIKDLHYFCDF